MVYPTIGFLTFNTLEGALRSVLETLGLPNEVINEIDYCDRDDLKKVIHSVKEWKTQVGEIKHLTLIDPPKTDDDDMDDEEAFEGAGAFEYE